MALVAFMRSWAGRLIRIVAGAVLVWFGLTHMAGPAGCLVAPAGAFAIAAGLVNACLIGPFFGLTLMGQRPATRQ